MRLVTIAADSLIGDLRSQKRMLVAAELTTLLRTSKNTLCKWVREAGLPAMRMPDHSYRFDPVRVAQWLEDRQM
jgi:hypothetical protein